MQTPNLITRRQSIQLVEVVDTMAIDPVDWETARRIHDCLQKHYPGHPWAVHADHKNGIAHFRLNIPEAIGYARTWAYVIKLADLAADPMLRTVRDGGGEFLERWGLPRREYRVGDVYRAMGHGLDKQLNTSKFNRYRPNEHAARAVNQAMVSAGGFEAPLIGGPR